MDSLMTFFSPTKGFYREHREIPNWMDHTKYGYEMVRMDDANEVESRTGFFVNIRLKPGMADLAYQPGKGKAVATWNYKVGILPSEGEAPPITMFSDDNQKHIICSPEGYVYATPSRMVPMGGAGAAYPQLRMACNGHEFAMTPFVVLAFFMWLESDEDEGAEVRNYLKTQMGWPDAKAN
jgi:hypothetical protein